MTGKSRFRYALEPVRLVGKWNMNTLLAELGKLNVSSSACKREISDINKAMDVVSVEWRNRSEGDSDLAVGGLKVMSNYMRHLSARCEEQSRQLAKLEEARDLLIEQVAQAKKAADAVERHHDKMQGEFIRSSLRSASKTADDHWSALQFQTEKNNDQS